MSRALAAMALVMATAAPVDAGALCTWLGHCRYESPGFRIAVRDGLTGQPLADVHALAEWQTYRGGRPGAPLMVQDAASRADGRLAFPPWGPLSGPREGLVLNSDPVISLFRAGYRTVILNNPFPVGTEETERVRGSRRDGEIVDLVPFRATPSERAAELTRIAFGLAGPREEEDTERFRAPYLDRLRRVRAELRTLPQDRPVSDLLWAVERSTSSLEGASR